MKDLVWLLVTIAIFAVIFIRFHYLAEHKHLECQKCSYKFKVSAVDLLFAPHVLLRRLIKCPACGRLSFMELIDD